MFEREIELAERMTAPGAFAARVSASEGHEVCDWVRESVGAFRRIAVDLGVPSREAVELSPDAIADRVSALRSELKESYRLRDGLADKVIEVEGQRDDLRSRIGAALALTTDAPLDVVLRDLAQLHEAAKAAADRCEKRHCGACEKVTAWHVGETCTECWGRRERELRAAQDEADRLGDDLAQIRAAVGKAIGIAPDDMPGATVDALAQGVDLIAQRVAVADERVRAAERADTPTAVANLHAHNSALLRENDALKKRLFEADADGKREADPRQTLHRDLFVAALTGTAQAGHASLRADQQAPHIVNLALAVADAGTSVWASHHLPPAAEAPREPLPDGVPPDPVDAYNSGYQQGVADGLNAAGRDEAPAATSPDGSDDLDDEEVERIVAAPRDEWCGDLRTIDLALEVRRRRAEARARAGRVDDVKREVAGEVEQATAPLLEGWRKLMSSGGDVAWWLDRTVYQIEALTKRLRGET